MIFVLLQEREVPNKVRSNYASAAVGILLGFIPAFPAASQEVLGKTVQAKFSIVSCNTTNGICLPTQTSKINVYVSPQGHVYDYTGSEQGNEYALGVTKRLNATGTVTFIAGGSTLAVRSDISGGNYTYTYTIRGNTCVVSGQGSFRNVKDRISTLSCSVVDGNPN
jgi:hypothetical protein